MKRIKCNLIRKIMAAALSVVLIVEMILGSIPVNAMDEEMEETQETVSSEMSLGCDTPVTDEMDLPVSQMENIIEEDNTASGEIIDPPEDLANDTINGIMPVESHEHNGIVYDAWTADDSLPTTAGNYYLTKDVTLSGYWDIPENTTHLCLNGKTIRTTGDVQVINISSGSKKLSLYDCTGGGKVTGGQQSGVNNAGTFEMYGGEITGNKGLHNSNFVLYNGGGVYNTGTFYLYNGIISGNTASDGGGIYNDGVFQMRGGKITGNSARDGGGIYSIGTLHIYGGEITGNSVEIGGGGILPAAKNSVYGPVTIGGSAVISGNARTNGEVSNLFIFAHQIIIIDPANPLSYSARIGVTTVEKPISAERPVNITGENSVDYSEYFYSDSTSYDIVDSGSDHIVQLTLAHIHEFNREIISPDTLKSQATCTQAAIYYKSCQCGEISTRDMDTFTSGSPSDHHYTEMIQDVDHQKTIAANCQDYNTYWYDCEWCDANAKYDTAGNDRWFVGTVAGPHSYDSSVWNYKEADGHAHQCLTCHTHDTIKPHTPGLPATTVSPQTCTTCGYIIAPVIGHVCNPKLVAMVEASCTGSGKQAYYHCEGCNKNYEDAEGTRPITNLGAWGNIAAPGHMYGSNWKSDGSGHWQECSHCGGKTGMTVHNRDGGTVTVQPTGTTPGIKIYNCTECGYEMSKESIPAGGDGSRPGGAVDSVGKDIYTDGKAPAIQISTPADRLADIILTEAEKQQAANGVGIKIILDVKDISDSVGSRDKALVDAVLDGQTRVNGYTVGQYFAISLSKVVGDAGSSITKTGGPVTIVVTIPEDMKNTNSQEMRTFSIIRVYDGVAEVLDDLDDNDGTITIETDRFSAYALVYKDTVNSGDSSAGSNQNGNAQNNHENSQRPGNGGPKTGDNVHLELYATLAMVAGLSYLYLYFTEHTEGMTEVEKQKLVSVLIAWAKQGSCFRKPLAFAAIFLLLLYYHSIGKACVMDVWNV